MATVKLQNVNKIYNNAVGISELLGNEIIVYGTINRQKILIKTDAVDIVKAGETVCFYVNSEKMYFFDSETQKRIR